MRGMNSAFDGPHLRYPGAGPRFGPGANVAPNTWETLNDLEDSEDRRGAGGHGNQHVRLRCAQVDSITPNCPARAAICRLAPGSARFSTPLRFRDVRDSGIARILHRPNVSYRSALQSFFHVFTPGAFEMRMPPGVVTFRIMLVCLATLAPVCARAEGIDTEHLFGFMIGSDVGNVGERELQSQTTGRFAKESGNYRAIGQQLELEFVPARDFRIELGSVFSAHDITGVAGFDDRRQLAWQGVSVDFRYRFLDRDTAPLGLTVAVETHADRIDETSGAAVRSYGSEFTLALDREVVPKFAVAALNLIYQPEWTRMVGTGAAEQESTVGAAFALMARMRPDLFFGGEARYLRKYDGIGLEQFAGQALFVGPTAYFQLSERSRLTASWSVQAWGRSAGSNAALDLVNFERHQARLVFGVNF
jgi:hypothetical protein